MDAPQSALDSLRTVEFRETLKGYHRDDVDEYLEKAAVEADALHLQLRQASDRLRQAGERIAQLEAALEAKPEPTEGAGSGVPDDTLQRTLLLAQQFVDQTKADAEQQARKLVGEAEERARRMLAEAETRAGQIASESEKRLRDEVTRLDAIRKQLGSEVEGLARHLEGERARLRSALSDVLKWVDTNMQSAPILAGQGPTGPGGPPKAPGPADRPAPASSAHPGGPGETGTTPARASGESGADTEILRIEA
ncbi:MAG: DivIVA domain-containing protein [Actinomycetota bacterium]|nr:DivIVA domain-containing protein [Actinomycetota bacterium]